MWSLIATKADFQHNTKVSLLTYKQKQTIDRSKTTEVIPNIIKNTSSYATIIIYSVSCKLDVVTV